MAFTYEALKAELENPEYAGMSDAEAADALNEADIPIKVDIGGDVMKLSLMVRGVAVWDKLLDAAAGHAQANVKTAAVGFIDAVKFIGNWLTSDPATNTALANRLGTFVNATPPVMNIQQRDGILALADKMISRATELEWPAISAADVTVARAL